MDDRSGVREPGEAMILRTAAHTRRRPATQGGTRTATSWHPSSASTSWPTAWGGTPPARSRARSRPELRPASLRDARGQRPPAPRRSCAARSKTRTARSTPPPADSPSTPAWARPWWPLLVEGERAAIAHVGDSRAYRVPRRPHPAAHGRPLDRRRAAAPPRDHRRRRPRHPHRHVLTRALGVRGQRRARPRRADARARTTSSCSARTG